MPFQEGDTVRIVKQPRRQTAYIAGQLGFVDEVRDDGQYYVQTLDKAGRPHGAGTVPAACLARETSFDAEDRKAKYDLRLAGFLREAVSRADELARAWTEAVADLAVKHDLKPSVVDDIGTTLLKVHENSLEALL